MITYIILLFLLFYILGLSADAVVVRTKKLAERFNIGIVALGMVLGILTTLPEFFVGINSIALNLPSLYFGNLMGGVIVILCLILGLSIVLNRKIKTDGKYASILPISFALLLPMFMGLDGSLGYFDGLTFIFVYLVFLFKDTVEHVHLDLPEMIKNRNGIARDVFWIMLGIVFLILSSNLIVVLTSRILSDYNVAAVIIGLLVFSLGTNLPELVVTLKSWSKHVSELSVSHLLGSALANLLVLGVLVVIKPITFEVGESYKFLFIALSLGLGALTYFYKSDSLFTKREGLKLLSIYAIFVIGQIIFS